MTTFDELFASHRLKPAEREQLVWHLAYMRMRKTIEALSRPDYGTVNEDAIKAINDSSLGKEKS